MNDNKTEYLSLYLTKEDKAKVEAMRDNYAMQLEVVKKIFTREKDWMKQEYQLLSEEVLKYRALLLTARQEFTAAQEEHTTKLDEFWEEFFDRLPKLKDKVKQAVHELQPITTAVKELNVILEGVSAWRIKDMMSVVEQVQALGPERLQMLQMLIENFKQPKL